MEDTEQGHTNAELADILRVSNESRVKDLEVKSQGQVNLENAFDALKMIVHLEHIAAKLDIVDETQLDFEGRRAEMLTEIENKVAQMFAARDAAQRQAVLSGGMPPQGAGPRIVRPR